ncbi:MAG: hypothetical protein GXZ19_01725 [Bacteroidales bacterium]|nr:hypothetical protein [Bacteroidales bacterium]
MRELGIQQNSGVIKLLQDYKRKDPTIIPANGDDLMAKIGAGQAIFLDVSSEVTYHRCHLHNAISIPL